MQIGSGSSSLSLALLKALGAQVPGGPAAQTAAAAAPAATSTKTTDIAQAPAPESGTVPDLGVARTIPRGSFIDFKA